MEHEGHRKRLRDRFLKGGSEALHDYEILELILFMAIPRRDVKPLAKELLTHYKSLTFLLNAPLLELSSFPGLTEGGAIALKVSHGLAERVTFEKILEAPLFNKTPELEHYARLRLKDPYREQLLVFFLDKKGRYLGEKITDMGTLGDISIHPREIVRAALSFNCSGLILVHNHPHDEGSPSPEDISSTEILSKILAPLEIRIVDHLILGQTARYSFEANGLLP